MKHLVAFAFLITVSGAEASRWTPIATRADADPTGLYVEKDSFTGAYPVRRAREKFLNSYREETVSLVEMNCARGSWRTLETVIRGPKGQVLRRAKSTNASSSAIGLHAEQEKVRRLLCKAPTGTK